MRFFLMLSLLSLMSCANLKDKFNLKRLPSSEDVQTLMDIKKQYDSKPAVAECTDAAKTAGECQ